MLRSVLTALALLLATPVLAQDSCEYANDNECDEARFGGQGYCDAGTDTADCALLSRNITDDSCTFANDGECDEFRYGGTGACQDGSDTADCNLWQVTRETDFLSRARSLGVQQADIEALGNNTCRWSNDGECDDPALGGTGACDSGTDATDCLARVDQGTALVPMTDPIQLTPSAPQVGLVPMSADSCEYAHDNECDEARYGGGGYCETGTDTSDCRQLAAGIDDDSCRWANDGACDEARYGGGGQCRDGTDATDCSLYGNSPDARARLLDLVPGDLRARLGDDSCEYANDGECDDAAFGGTVYCASGTDASDCRALALGGEDSCRWANDGECDEPGIGTDNCASGTDRTDCAAVAYLRNRTDSCSTAFDGVCNEPDGGDGTCPVLSDTADCLGRSRPAGLENHFFGRDDRFLVDATQLPWRAIGSLELHDGTCTGTLVGPSLVLTAAHCVTESGEETVTPLRFSAGLSQGRNMGEAKVTGAVFDPSYRPDVAPPGGGNGHDWALVMLDRPLGDEVGFLRIHQLTDGNLSQIAGRGLLVNQAGYSWDTGDNLSGNQGCRVVEAYEDNSILHECDTAQGDSGSPFLLNVDGEWKIIAIDSTFFNPEDDKTPFAVGNLAVDSRAFAAMVLQQQ
ncbi:trypsin-like serine peptidase [Thalassorhabdomicrobium marinisediminis]|uniref:Serine protease n=1 Tax=Thalassorhabdomicrobium marinisediminis TaxID=2170577 RepID=A0A2T7FYK3_9RHOB|nr:trypsin-like serine protease [Thalassorhabdomicrobium marinisediminis]PVA07249.1 hypothetical protein DC363_05210 [Thalassorhabdomicrobium marinisediminis]